MRKSVLPGVCSFLELLFLKFKVHLRSSVIDSHFSVYTPTYSPCPLHQLRNLVDMCINPDPEKRPDITYVYGIAKHMQNITQGS